MRKPVLTVSDAQRGSDLLARSPVVDVAGSDGERFLTDEECRLAETLSPESKVVEFLTPKLCQLLPVGTVSALVNGERYAWIDTGEREFFLKPGLFVVASCFWSLKGEENGRNRDVLSSWELRDAVSTLMEAKLYSVDEACGRLIKGMEYLCNKERFAWRRYGVALLN